MKSITLITAVVLFSTTACLSQINHPVDTGSNQTKTVLPAQDTNQLQAIFDNYYAIKDALVKTNANTASAKAAKLLTALNAMKMKNLSLEEQTLWTKIDKDLKMDAQHISESKEIDHQRDHFSTLSKNMYALIKIAKHTGKVYYQHCPMYDGGKGADWLSKESAIKNPYYGSTMLTCGKTIEVIQ